jgi:XTP/dITP diphosphohydrolase
VSCRARSDPAHIAPRRGGGSECLIIASHNAGKVQEIAELLSATGVSVRSAADLGLPEPEETGESFVANALIKARSAARLGGLAAIADDSGLCVRALGGAPGVHSARWAGPRRDFGAAMSEVQKRLADARDRRAAFVCALALAYPDGREFVYEGRVEGVLVWPPRGSHGFGYDPMFVPDQETRTFGEMLPAEKHAISHRARAFALFKAAHFPT